MGLLYYSTLEHIIAEPNEYRLLLKKIIQLFAWTRVHLTKIKQAQSISTIEVIKNVINSSYSPTLESGINIAPRIKVASGKFDKKEKYKSFQSVIRP